ncbi:hypothetical protein [Streptosporangium sandarakinum]|uniref:hypothetical protein n=1 Tax=Streptosporangium sandarakinum TaxID=1260955 RepID=UPI00341A5557
MPTTYVSTASMVLTTPATGGTLPADPTRPTGLTNPLLQFSDGLRVTAGILILSMNTPEVAAELGLVKGGTTEITINDGRTNPDLLGISTNGPFVYVEVRSRSAAEAQKVVVKAKQRIRKELLTRQQALRAPRSTYISVVDVVPSSTPEAKVTNRLTAAGGVLFAVLAVGFGVAYGVTEARAGRRRRAADPADPFSPKAVFPEPAFPERLGRSEAPAAPEWAHVAATASATGAEPPPAVYPPGDVPGSAEGPFHDDPAQLVVVLDEEEPPERDGEHPGGDHGGSGEKRDGVHGGHEDHEGLGGESRDLDGGFGGERGRFGGDPDDDRERFGGDPDDDRGERAADTVAFTRAGGRGHREG